VDFTNTLPSGLVVATPSGLNIPNNTNTGCNGGTATATAGSSTVSFGTNTQDVSSTCIITVNVTATTPGTKSNTVTLSFFGGSDTKTATLTVIPAASTTTLTSSLNPSQAGQAVAFTATVTGTSPTGTVTFKDGAAVLGTVALSGGVATLTNSSLTTGSHSITAEYGGDANNGPSASAALIQTVNTPADSLKLRSMQVLGTKVAAQTSGQAISGAIGSAIGQGFSGNGFQMGVNGTPFSIAALGTAPSDTRMSLGAGLNGARETPPSRSAWTPWVDVRGTGWNTDAKDADIDGTQLNVLAGLTWRPASDFIVGALAGYESFNYSSDLLTGQLDGNGWTVGGYLGWRLAPGLLLDLGGTRSDIDYDASAGTAAGSFTGERWLVSGGLTGTYRSSAFIFEPSARVFALWESEDAYVDNLGTAQDARDFSTGRASAGLKVGYPVAWSRTVTVMPYAGAFADYYFSSDNAAALTIPVLLPEEFVDGAAARIVSGLAVTVKDGARLALDGELGGLGNDFETWTARGSFATPF
jgi:outer membrane autotransporter protein